MMKYKLLLLLLLLGTGLGLHAQPGTLDTAFDPGLGADNDVFTTAIQPDGKIIIGGQFTAYNGTTRSRVARLNADGTLDTAFDPGSGANGIVQTSALQPDGKIIIGGEFTSYNGTPRNRVARLNADGSLDTAFDPGSGANNTVLTSALQSDGKIIIGGAFTSFNGTAHRRITRLNADGSLDTSFDPGSGVNQPGFFPKFVATTAIQSDGKIIIGGRFTTYDGTNRISIARLNSDGSLDTSFNPAGGLNGTVFTTAIQPDGKIIIGGTFTSPRNRIARLNANGSLDTAFDPVLGPGTNGTVFTTAIRADGKIIIGGAFTAYSGTNRSRIARLKANGSVDTAFDPGSGANGTVRTLALQPDEKIIIGGSFTTYNGTTRNQIARVNAEDASCEPTPITCPANMVTSNDSGDCGALVSFNLPDGATATPPSGSFFPVGTTTVDVEGSDGCDGTSSCSFTVTVNDTEAPTANCPSHVTVSNNTGQCGANVSFSIPIPTDNCPGASSAALPASGSFFDIGTTPVTVTATDAAGNTGTCSFNVTVNDTEAPTANCPGNVTVNNDPGECGADVSFSIPDPTDNCSATSVALPASGSFFEVGTTPVTITATDATGNQGGCTFNVTVTDNEKPEVDCKDFSVDLNASGEFTLTTSFLVNNAYNSRSDNCELSTIINITGPPTYTCANIGSTSRNLFTLDIYGNTMSCLVTVTVNDLFGVCNQPPVAKCKDITVSTAPNTCEASITPAQVDDNSTDPDGDALQLSLDNSGPFASGIHTVELTVNDGSLSDKCTAMVTVNDTEAPTANCPSNVTVSNNAGQCGANVSFSIPAPTDNCSASSAAFPASGSFFGIGTTPVTVTATDGAGNTGACSFNVTVNDTEAPTANCPSNVTVSNNAGQCGANVSFSVPNPTDNCPGASSAAFPASGSFFGIGTTPVTITATDGAGNTGACSFNVTVNDTEAPTANCPSNVTVSNNAGQCGANVSFSIPDPTDNCSASSAAFPASGSFFGIGTTPVTVTATDGAGNTGACSFNVTVNDTEAPKFNNCPSNITVNNDTGDCGANVSWTAPTISDNCSGASATSTHDPGDFFAVGTTTVTYSGSDAADNDAVDCSFTVTVNDTEKPSLSCTSNTTVGTDAGECGADVTIPSPNASDNCSVVELKARYRSVDEDGDATSSWSSRVTDPSGYFPVGRYQIQWRAKDAAGKKRTCSYYLEVEDDEDPTAVCKNVTVDFNGQSDVNLSVSQVWNESASDDNCSTLHYVGTAPSLNISCEDVGNSFPLTVTIQDEAGNKDQCTATINVIGLACGWSEGVSDGSLNCGSNTSATYDRVDESFDLSANGCWHDCLSPDKAAHVYQLLCGDGQLTARLASINSEGYAGLMARESLDPESRRAGVLKNNSTRRVRREYRASNGGVVTQRPSNRSRVEWLRIVRQGTKIKSYTSTNGSSWRLLYQVTFPGLADCIYVDMMAYSLNGSAEVEATFDQVSITGGGSSYIDNTTLPGSFTQLDTDIDLGQAELNIFPNPSNGVSQLELNGFVDAPAQIWVRDAFGKVVRQIELDAPQGMVLPLDLTGLPAGLYLITAMQDQREVVTKKLVLQR